MVRDGRYGLELQKIDGMNILTSPRLIEERSLFVAFSGRLGGHSSPPFDSLNISLLSGDNAGAVISNRSKLTRGLALDSCSLVVCNQVHGNDVLPVNEELVGNGADGSTKAIPHADGFVSDLTNIPVLLQFADCVPVAVFDVEKKIALALHCGRSGIEANIIGRGVSLLTANWGSDPADLAAFIGPSIGPCCYEVGTEVATKFADKAGESYVVAPDIDHLPDANQPRLDLWSAAEGQLKINGVAARSLTNPRICTSCNRERYFSHRADNGLTGRHAMIVAVLP